MEQDIKIGIIGGSGIYNLEGMKEIKRISFNTKQGKPSDKIIIGKYANKMVAFLPRHGFNHSIPPHEIPYEANIAAFKKIGVSCIISTSMCGSINLKIKPGDLVFPDQFINFTHSRKEFSKNIDGIIHIPMASPYCSELNKIFYKYAKSMKMSAHRKKTVVVIQGPRYSTKAESKWFSFQGWDIINMTQYPECYFARRMKIHYGTIGLITDYDAGLNGKLKWTDRDAKKIMTIFNNNVKKANSLIFQVIKNFPDKFICDCCEYLTKSYYK